jgi:hypothetical protein
MQTNNNSTYKIKRDFDVFHSGTILPLVEGKNYFASTESSSLFCGQPNMSHVQRKFPRPYKRINKESYATRRLNWPFPHWNTHPFETVSLNRTHSDFPLIRNFRNVEDGTDGTENTKSKEKFLITQSTSTEDAQFDLQNQEKTKQDFKFKIILNSTDHSEKLQTTKLSKNVFTSDQKVRDLILAEKELLIASTKSRVKFNKNKKMGSLKNFGRISKLLHKFLLGRQINRSEIKNISDFEKKVLIMYMNTKKSVPGKIKKLTIQNLKNLQNEWMMKSSDQNRSFILNRTFKHLKDIFRQNLYSKVSEYLRPEYACLNKNAKFDYCFYGYYFLDSKSYISRNIESFFHPNSRRNPDIKNKECMPTSTTEIYMNKLRTSPLFVRDFVLIQKKFILCFAEDEIALSLVNTFKAWEKMIGLEGLDPILVKIEKRLKDQGKKHLPWGKQEISNAIEDILLKIGSISHSN